MYYFVKYGDFYNQYELVYSDKKEIPGFDRISRKEAERLCAAERRRRREDPSFAGYATALIYPADFDIETEDPYNARRFRINGCILERKED